jgi:hypothetical protein
MTESQSPYGKHALWLRGFRSNAYAPRRDNERRARSTQGLGGGHAEDELKLQLGGGMTSEEFRCRAWL